MDEWIRTINKQKDYYKVFKGIEDPMNSNTHSMIVSTHSHPTSFVVFFPVCAYLFSLGVCERFNSSLSFNSTLLCFALLTVLVVGLKTNQFQKGPIRIRTKEKHRP